MNGKWWRPGLGLLLLLATSLACSVPALGTDRPVPTPTPLGNTLSFTNPAFTYTLSPGDSVPGTRLNYVGREGDTYRVTIDGLAAVKRTGDSFIWSGGIAPGVIATYNLRLTTALFGSLPVAGPVQVTVFYPEPVAQEVPPETATTIVYRNTVVDYLVPAGRQIPGTTLVYVGAVTQGEGDQVANLAQLAGGTGYPYLAAGDSLRWSGRLREHVAIEYALRVVGIDENGLRVAGVANLWVQQGP